MHRQFSIVLCLGLAVLFAFTSETRAQRDVRFRKLAPGVLVTVPPNTREGKSLEKHRRCREPTPSSGK